MPERKTIKRAQKAARAGKAPTTQAGEFVREEMHHIREGKHGARSSKQAIAIGLSKARKAGVRLGRPAGRSGSTPAARPRKRIASRGIPSSTRSKAITNVLKREPRSAASRTSLARQAHATAQKRGPEARHKAALKAVRTKGPQELSEAAQKAARTRKKAA